jgi:hypothetical protein
MTTHASCYRCSKERSAEIDASGLLEKLAREWNAPNSTRHLWQAGLALRAGGCIATLDDTEVRGM